MRTVRAAATLQPLAQNFRRCAVHWTGPIHDHSGTGGVVWSTPFDPAADAIVIEVEIFGRWGPVAHGSFSTMWSARASCWLEKAAVASSIGEAIDDPR